MLAQPLPMIEDLNVIVQLLHMTRGLLHELLEFTFVEIPFDTDVLPGLSQLILDVKAEKVLWKTLVGKSGTFDIEHDAVLLVDSSQVPLENCVGFDPPPRANSAGDCIAENVEVGQDVVNDVRKCQVVDDNGRQRLRGLLGRGVDGLKRRVAGGRCHCDGG